jgi:VWFA-related protein
MLTIVLALALAAGGFCPPAAFPPQAAAQQPTFRSGIRTVPLYVTVTDGTGRLVPELTQADFEILDNGKPQAIVLFLNEVQPITVVVMLDTSLSMTGSMDLLRAAAEQFVLRLLPADRARVGYFNDKIEVMPREGFTSNRDDLLLSLREVDYGNPTRLWDAVGVSLDELRGIEGRRVILVFTDGDDMYSRDTNFSTVVQRARDEGVMVYAIGLQSDFFNGQRRIRSRPDRSLRKIADETGGGYFELEKTDQLTSTFTRVAQELHSQYVLAFQPPALDGKRHELEVKVKQAGMRARARKSYVASAEKITGTR